MTDTDDERLLKPGEVAAILRVNAKTVTRWADAGLLTYVRPNPRGFRRYRESDVRALLNSSMNTSGEASE